MDPTVSMSRKSGLVGPVLDLAAELEHGGLAQDDYLDGLEKARGRFARLKERMLEVMHSGKAFESYRDGLSDSLEDAFTMLSWGIEELRDYKLGASREAVRIGRLLLEKGEQEYLAVLEILQSDAPGSERERTLNLWGQLLEASRTAPDLQEWGETLNWAEWALGAHMDGTFRDFQRALAVWRENPEDHERAQEKALASLPRLRECLGLAAP